MQIVFGVIALFIIVVALLWILVPAFYGLPPISSRKERIRRALELTNPKAGETLYDLGSGHGHVLVIAVKEFGLNAVGIEAGPVQTVDGLRSTDPDDALIVSSRLSRQCGMA